MEKLLARDVVEWDVYNWSRGIDLWKKFDAKGCQGKKILDIGGRSGGLSLYWALQGADKVICSDVNDNAFENAKKLHKKYHVEDQISYEIIDATNIPFENEFDIICFKSVLGGVGYNNNYENQKLMIKNIYDALKPGGKLFFVENLQGSFLHSFARKKFVKWGNRWRYVTIQEIKEMLEMFSEVKYTTIGFLGCFGRNAVLSDFLGHIDVCCEKLVGEKNRYILSCVAKK